MKKIILVAFVATLVVSCGKKGNVEITGTYPDGKGEILSVEMLNISETIPVDSAKVGNSGNFRSSFNLSNPELILLKSPDNKVINLLVFPGDKIHVDITGTGFSTGYTVNGSEESENIRMLVETLAVTKHQLDSISDAFDALADKESPEASVLVSTYQQVFIKQKRNNIRFIVEHLNSLSSVYALYQRISPDILVMNELKDLQYFKIVADSLRVNYPGSTLSASLANDVDKRMKEYNATLALNNMSKDKIIESGHINLEIENTEGNTVNLSSLDGKVIMLLFWASWDNASREAARKLRNIYNQYHKRGFEIYAVGLESNRNAWRTAIDFEEYPWINVSELTYPYSYAASAYNVSELPTSYLIDREGNIVAKNLSGSLLATWLDNLL